MEIILLTLGLSLGSFLNVLIDRSPKNESAIRGRSHCDFCRHKLKWYDLIPLLSFILLRRKCRYCKSLISWQYPAVEAATALLFIFTLSVVRFDPTKLYIFLYHLALFSGLLVIFVTDLKYRIIPDNTLIFLVSLTLIYKILYFPEFLLSSFITGIVIFLFFLLLVIVTFGRGMGMGDVKYAFFMGFLLDYPKIAIAFYLSFLTGALLSLILVLNGRKSMKSTIAFGPFMVVATFISYIYGLQLWVIFKRLVGI